MSLTWTDDDFPEQVGWSKNWLQKNRRKLEADGFPKKDPLLKRYIAADVKAWLENRRQVREKELLSGDATTQEEPDFDQI